MKISAIQMNSGSGKTANLAQAADLVSRSVAADGPDMVVLPEVFAHIGGSVADRRGAAEELPQPGEDGGTVYEALRGLARDHGIFVHGGSFIERVGDDFFNTSVAFDRGGRELVRYRKVHLFDVTTPDGKSYRESDTFGAGDAVATYQADGLTIGCSICYDLRFAELYRLLAEQGADVIMVPSAFTLQTGKDHWEVLLRGRAIETQTYMVAAAQTGTHTSGNEQRETWGHSMIVDPWGNIVAQASENPGFATGAVDCDYIATVRGRIPVRDHRVF
ncbi:MAG: putative amidohydrolase [Alphaproteobacteria bacterium]|jgi:predicted amidohydrolase